MGLILNVKSPGIKSIEIGEIINTRNNNKIGIEVAILKDKLVSIDERIKQLKQMKKMISQF